MVNASGKPSTSPTPPGVRTANPVPPARKNHQMMNGGTKKGQTIPQKGQVASSSQRPQTKVSSSKLPGSPVPPNLVTHNVVQAQDMTSKQVPRQTQKMNPLAPVSVVEVQPQQVTSQKQPLLKPEQPQKLAQQHTKPADQIHEKDAVVQLQQLHSSQAQANPSQQQLNPLRQPNLTKLQLDLQMQPQVPQQQKPSPTVQQPHLQPQTQPGQQQLHQTQITSSPKQQEKPLVTLQPERSSSLQRPGQHQESVTTQQVQLKQTESQPLHGKPHSQSPQEPLQVQTHQQYNKFQKSDPTQPQLQQFQQSLNAQPSQQSQQVLQTQKSLENQNLHPTPKLNTTSETRDSTPSLTPNQSPLQSPEISLQLSDAQQQILQRQRQLRPAPKPSINGIVLDQPVQANTSKDESNFNSFLKQQMAKSPNSTRRVLVRKVKPHLNQSLSEQGYMQNSPAGSAPAFLSGAGKLQKRSFGGFQPRDQAKQILGQHINRRLSQDQVPGGASQPNLTISQGDLDDAHSRDESHNNLVTMADFSVSTPENLASVNEAFPTTLASTQSTQRQQTTSQLSLPSQTLLVSPSPPSLQTSLTSPGSIISQASRPQRLLPKCGNFSSSLDHVALPAEAIIEVANSATIGQENPAEVDKRRSSADEGSAAAEGSVLKCGAVRSQVFSPQYRKNKSIIQPGVSSRRTSEHSIKDTISNDLEKTKTTSEVLSIEKTSDNAPDNKLHSNAKNCALENKRVSADVVSPIIEDGSEDKILTCTKETLTSETSGTKMILPAPSVDTDKRADPTKETISPLQKTDVVTSLSPRKPSGDIAVGKTNGELTSDTSLCSATSDKQASEAGKEVRARDDGVSVKQKRFNEMKNYKIGEKCRLQVEARAETLQKDQSGATADDQSAISLAGGTGQQPPITGAELKNDSCLDRNNNDNIEEMFRKMYGKELASLQAKYEAQVENLTASLALKEEELTRTRSEATVASEALARSRDEQQLIKTRLTKEKEEIEEKHRKEREVREQEEKEKREREEKARKEREEKEKREAEEKRKKEEEEEAERKLKEEDAKKTSESEGTENEDEEKEETEEESNRRKIDKMQMEMLLLKQQNEEFEEMVREKYRRQVELELQIGEISNEVTQKEAAIQSVRVELSYAKNETALTREKVKQLEQEVEAHKKRVEALEQELDTAERELKRMEILQEKLRVTENRRNDLQAQIDEIEVERDEEIKIIQDALDEAAQEREELLTTFEKEIEKLNSLNAAREAQMLQEFEDKLKELEQQHKNKLEEKEREAKTALHRNKRLADEEDVRQRLERLRSQLTSEWEDKLRSECARLKGELDSLHSEEKHLAVESIRVQKEQELQEVRKGVDGKVEALNKEISELKQSLVAKDEFYQQEIDEIRTRADRDVWELRRKLQKLDESSYDRQQHLEDKHREDLERLREEYADKMAGLEAQLSCVDVRGLTDLRTKLEADHKQQMEHLGEQHRLSMERLRDELEAEKVQAAEEVRVIVSKHHEYINESLKEQLADAVTSNTQYREEIEAIKFALSRREEVIKSLEEDVAKLRGSNGSSPLTGSSPPTGSPPPTGGSVASSSSFQFPHEGSQGSRSSQDRLSNDTDEDGHKGSGLLGKVFGGGWFSGNRGRDSTTPAYSSPAGGSSKKNRQST